MLCSLLGTSVLQVTATDADDPTYGNSARIVYSILQGQPYFSVDPKTGVVIIACLEKMLRQNKHPRFCKPGSNKYKWE